MHTNDVFALYLTGTKVDADGNPIAISKKPPVITSTQFPSTDTQLQEVNDFAQSYGYTIDDLDAMAIELKTSWVDAATLTETELPKYVLSQAVVPVFDRSNPKKWTVKDNETKTLALVGMHVVGSVNSHPELIWSTFEHVDNVPDATYTYTTTSGSGQVKFDSAGTWTFTPSNAPMPTTITSDAAVATDGSGAIESQNDLDIGPVTNVRAYPWGNDEDPKSPFCLQDKSLCSKTALKTAIENTTDLVSINVSVLSQLAEGDIRGNYIQTGGIWTSMGQVPAQTSTDQNPQYDSDLRGSLNLANSTMETFYQFYNGPKNFNPKNCFGCHSLSEGQNDVEVSHIYDELLPLPELGNVYKK